MILKYNKKQKYIVADAETTGLNLRYSVPWEFSYILCEGDNIKKEQQCYIDIPDLPNILPPFIKKLTGFNEAKYKKNKRPAKEVFDEISKYKYDPDYFTIGQNYLGFDIYMWNVLSKLAGYDSCDQSYIQRVLDTRSLGLAFKQEDKPKFAAGTKEFACWQISKIMVRDRKHRVSQGQMLKDFDIDHDPDKLHDGLYDVGMTFQIFKQLAKKIEL